ncbi:glycosyltransferase [Photobacterium leiognathi subsp. mandapamensis]|uniref:glycosyltransferase n=1 Tax=Photobacterium leiognathi TaxID=553611 RepID=UPI003AF375E3
MNKQTFFLTGCFPYEGGEHFIENEIPYWNSNSENEVTIFPLKANGKKRDYPKEIKVDTLLTKKITVKQKLKGLVLGVFSKYLFREIYTLIKQKKINYKNVVTVVKVTAKGIILSNLLEDKIDEGKSNYIYCYWNNELAIAGVILKDRKKNIKVFTRCHRYDLYEEHHELKYIPFKRQFANKYDKWFVICESAKNYLTEKYGVKNENIALSRLGVEVHDNLSSISNNNCLNIVSVSYCVPVKQVDKIIKAISDFSSSNPEITIRWTHIGGGELMNSLQDLAFKLFEGKNIKSIFLGNVSNNKVNEFFLNNKVDVFINASASEGVPVSIMEAMEFGIPVIAPNVGGISELLELDSCILLPEKITEKDICNAIFSIYKSCKDIDKREACKTKINNEYNAQTNFKSFIENFK